LSVGHGGGVAIHSRETVIELNGVKIEAFPSHHLDAMRGLSSVSFILLDEADFFPPGQQQAARDVSERYICFVSYDLNYNMNIEIYKKTGLYIIILSLKRFMRILINQTNIV